MELPKGITPEMIGVGVRELASFNIEFESRESAVCRIFAAMRAMEASETDSS